MELISRHGDGSLCIHNIIDCVLMYELLMHDIIHSALMYYLMSCILQCSSTHSVQCVHLHWLTFEAGDLINMPIGGYYKLSSNCRQAMGCVYPTFIIHMLSYWSSY